MDGLLDEDTKKWAEGKIAYPDAATDSIVPTIASDNPLQVTSENFAEIIIEKSAFIGALPEVDGLYLKDNLDAYIERKLFTLNTGHAITAYLGLLKGYKTVKEAIADPEILASVKEAMHESGAVLIKRYGFDKTAHEQYIDKIISRFENPYLDDELERVGRDPLRKLSKNDRLIKPMLGAVEYGLPYSALLKGAVAALKMPELAGTLAQSGGLAKITGLSDSVPAEKKLLDELAVAIA